MIVKVNRKGSDSTLCQSSVSIPRGYRTISLGSIQLPDNSAERFPAFTGAFVVNGQTLDITAQSSINALVTYLNGLMAPDRVFECWYNSNTNDLELVTVSYATVTLSQEFVDYFQFPSTTLTTFDSGRIFNSSDPVHEYVVEVDAFQDGASEYGAFTQAIGYVNGSTGKPYDSYDFIMQESTTKIKMRVKYRLKTGDLVTCSCNLDQMWSVCLKLGV